MSSFDWRGHLARTQPQRSRPSVVKKLLNQSIKMPESQYHYINPISSEFQYPPWLVSFLLLALKGWRGGAMVGRRTSDHEVVGSIPGQGVVA